MKRYTSAIAKTTIFPLLDAAERGQPVIIERRGCVSECKQIGNRPEETSA